MERPSLTPFIYRIATLAVVLMASAFEIASTEPYLRQPAIAPDGTSIALVHAGDIYEVAADGGRARRVVSDDAYDDHPRYSPDGRWLAFTSLRTGGGDVYVLDRDSGEVRRLTWHSDHDAVESWSADGRHVYFSSSRRDIFGYTDIYRVALDGSTPVMISGDRFEAEYNAAVSPDGETVAFNVNDRTRQWWRMGPRRSDATEIWTKSTAMDALDYRRLTTYPGTDSWPMWAPDGEHLYFVSDAGREDGVENVFLVSLDGTRKAITHFSEGRVLWPDISRSGRIVFERDFRIWTLDRGEEASPVDVDLEPAPEEAAPAMTIDRVDELAIAPSGDRLAVVMRGEVFVSSTGTPALRRVTDTAMPEQGAQWSPDGTRLAYSSLRDGYWNVYVQDVASGEERRLTVGGETQIRPRWSPRGDRIAFARGASGIDVIDVTSGATSTLAEGLMLTQSFEWSPTGDRVAYFVADDRWFSGLHVRSADDGEAPVRLTSLPHAFFGDISWSPSGAWLAFASRQEPGTEAIYRVDLRSRATSRLVTEVKEPSIESIFPGDSLIAYVAGTGPTRTLHVGAAGSETSSSRAIATARHFSDVQLVNGSLWFAADGAVGRYDLRAGTVDSMPLAATLEIDPRADRQARFREAWLVVRDYHGDETFNGRDWGSRYDTYLPYVMDARDAREFDMLYRLMIGELDASHGNIRTSHPLDVVTTADIGVDFDAATLAATGRLRVKHVVEGGPVYLVDSTHVVGAELVVVDGERLSPEVNVQRLLSGKAGEWIELVVRGGGAQEDDPGGAARSRDEDQAGVTRTIRVRGAHPDEVSTLRYEAWVRANAQYVDRLSEGRLGYIHRRHFGDGTVEEMKRRLDAELLAKDGLVLDMRYNGGGRESSIVASFLARPAVPRSSFRGRVDASSGVVHGQVIVGIPTVLVQNEQCLSDSENFSEIYRRMRLGTIVGMPTAGWVMGRQRYRLFDGTRIGVGAWISRDANGENMDRVPRPPDVLVDRPIGQTLEGDDDQLDAAIRVLLEEVEAR